MDFMFKIIGCLCLLSRFGNAPESGHFPGRGWGVFIFSSGIGRRSISFRCPVGWCGCCCIACLPAWLKSTQPHCAPAGGNSLQRRRGCQAGPKSIAHRVQHGTHAVESPAPRAASLRLGFPAPALRAGLWRAHIIYYLWLDCEECRAFGSCRPSFRRPCSMRKRGQRPFR